MNILRSHFFPFIIFMMIFIIYPVFGEKNPKITSDFKLTAGSELAATDYYALRAQVGLDFTVLPGLGCTLEIKADGFEIDTEQITFKWKPWDYLWVKGGKFKPELTLEEYMKSNDRLFITKNIISDYIDYLGYKINCLGARIYKNYDKETLPISYLLQSSYNTAAGEPQFMAGFFYHFDKKDSYLGFLGRIILSRPMIIICMAIPTQCPIIS